MNKPDNFDNIVRNCRFAADNAVLDTMRTPHVGADLTAAAVEATLRHTVANGMITINPVKEWAEWQAIKY